MSSTSKLAETIKILRSQAGGVDAAAKLRRYKRNYERFSKTRNLVAHGHCAGHLRSDPTLLIFQTFEKVEHDVLAVYEVPMEELARATTWGRELRDVLLAGLL